MDAQSVIAAMHINGWSGAVCGALVAGAGLAFSNSHYTAAKAHLSNLPPLKNNAELEEARKAAGRQHVVFLVAPPRRNRAILARRLARNRHFAPFSGGPVAVELGEMIEKRGITRESTEEERALALDDCTQELHAIADQHPLIVSMYLPWQRLRQRLFFAFDERTVIRLVTAQNLVSDLDDEDPDTDVEDDAVIQAAVESKSLDDVVDALYDARSWRVPLRGLEASAFADVPFEPLQTEHVRVDAARPLHDVAKDVRKIVAHSFQRCALRLQDLVAHEQKPVVFDRVDNAGGVRSIVGVCVAGAVVGGVAGHWLGKM